MKNKLSVSFWMGSFIIFTLSLVALLGPYMGLPDPMEQNLALEYHPPREGHPLGLGENGVDVLSQLVWASRMSLGVSLSAVFLCAVIGTLLGTYAGFKKGSFDMLLMRVVDIVYAFPGILLIVAIAAFLGPSLLNMLFSLVITGWASYARMMRAVALSLSEREFVQAARALGASNWRIVTRHLLPNLMAPLLVNVTYGIGSVIVAEASLGFLGLGAPAGTPSWGQMLNSGREVLTSATHLVIVPGSALVLTVLGFNLLGDGLRDFLDPKIRS